VGTGAYIEGNRWEDTRATSAALQLVRILCIAFPSLVLVMFGAALLGSLGTTAFLSGLLIPGFFGIGAVLASLRQLPRLAGAFAAIATICLLAPNALLMGYGVFFAGKGFPLIDNQLIALDRMLGFDWKAMLHWFNAHPALTSFLRYPYGTLDAQAILSLCILIGTRNHDRLCVLICANSLVLILVHLIAIFTPAIGAYGALGITSADHPAIHLLSADGTVQPSLALRAASELVIPQTQIMGLMTFPSYHSAWGALMAWVLWPYRWLRIPGAALGSMVVVSALIHGSHHLTDVLAGVALTALCLQLAISSRRRLSAHVLASLGPNREYRPLAPEARDIGEATSALRPAH
jgi:hypothetical protein